jgi:predicted cupin superfamily sugar epimerase
VARKVRNQGIVVVINLFLGWTLIGCVIALAMAFRYYALAVKQNGGLPWLPTSY